MSFLVAFVEVIVGLWVAGTVLVLAAGLVTGRPHRVTEWEARENARPTSSAVNTIYDRPLAPVVNIEWARSASLGRSRQPTPDQVESTTAGDSFPPLAVVPHHTTGGDAA